MTPLPSFLHDLPVEAHIGLWGLVVPAIAVGLFLAWLASPASPGARWTERLRRAAMSAAPAMGVVGVLLLLPRLIQLLHPDFGGGPQRWLLSTAELFVGDALSLQPLHAYDTAVLEHLALSAVVVLVLPLVALLHRILPPRDRPVLPLAWLTASVLALATVLVPFLAHKALAQAGLVTGLEFLAAGPLVGVLLAVRVLGAWPPLASRQRTPQSTATPAPEPDIRQAWIRAQVLDPEATSWFRLPDLDQPTQPAVLRSERSARAWAAAGAHGPPPIALDRLIGASPTTSTPTGQPEDGTGGHPATWLVGDLPPHTERALIDAFLADRAGVSGDRALVLVDDPAAARDRLLAALTRAHTWSPGALTAGGAELEEALARHRVPAVAFVAPQELSSRVVPLVARGGRAWAESLRWLVLSQPQRGTPLDVTHTAFALRRWALAVPADPPPSVLATGPDTPSTRAFLESVLPGRPVLPCALQPRAVAEARVWPALTERHSPSDPWSARAARAVADLEVDVQLCDAELDHLIAPHDRVRRVSRPDVTGLASVASMTAQDLPDAWREAHHRLPDPAARTHHALWHVRPSPLGHFLTSPGRLRSLHQRGELPRPRPVVGTRNRFLRLAHLRAALEDGHADEIALRKAFGDDVVDFALAEAEPTGTHVARVVDGDRVVRAPVLRGPHGVDAPEPGREALTAQRVSILDDGTGTLLGQVDEQVVATRYHPKRVFARHGRRYRVPLHTLDNKRGQLRVVPADPRDAITRPVLRMLLEPRDTVVDPVTRRQGGLEVTTLTLAALVTEEVRGAWVPGQDRAETFEPVRSRYDTEVRLLLPARAEPGPALGHLAGLVGSLLPSHLAIGPDDAEVIVVRAGLRPGLGAGVAVVDRHVGGLGIARALDDGTVVELLRWARAVAYACPCDKGCYRCTPESVLRMGADKQGVLEILPVG